MRPAVSELKIPELKTPIPNPRAGVNGVVCKRNSQYITDPLPETEIGKSRIYSAQNGLLLSADIHSLFDSIELGIDPDANYKIIVFGPVPTGIGGTRLRDSARSGTWRMSADLLRWHLRMCLYNNLKANSEPQTVWEEDLGEDPRGEILSQPDAAERMVSFSRAWEN
ncbi:hypothetical protein CBS147332_5461 [Penicillium roqueforti]|nr:hypothetical protein CBS147332_5461 [Penicillium roqueforti]KAI3125329.1 hypothetical protein CBS147331_323 [Penicillium roqueforti]